MNALAYFLVNGNGMAGPVLWIVNLIVYLIIAVILWMVLKWAAQEFGVPPRIVQLIGLLLFLLLVLALFTGCAIELHADGTKKVQFSPTVADYKAIRNLSR